MREMLRGVIMEKVGPKAGQPSSSRAWLLFGLVLLLNVYLWWNFVMVGLANDWWPWTRWGAAFAWGAGFLTASLLPYLVNRVVNRSREPMEPPAPELEKEPMTYQEVDRGYPDTAT